MRVAIQGISGSFHDQAAQQFFGNQALSLVECTTFRKVFDAVNAGSADYGIVAIENSLHGPLNPVYRLLASEKLWVSGEVRLRISLHLIGNANQSLGTLNTVNTEVFSHIAALSQCEEWLNNNLPSAKRTEAPDTAESVRTIMANKDAHHVAIASEHAAELYGGIVLAGPINDDPDNYTRFFILTKTASTAPAANRTSIILTEKDNDKPGSLYDALGIFKQHKINLSKLDSHPLPGKRRQYAFYIDFDSSLDSKQGQSAIEQLSQQPWDVQILGSYQASDTKL